MLVSSPAPPPSPHHPPHSTPSYIRATPSTSLPPLPSSSFTRLSDNLITPSWNDERQSPPDSSIQSQISRRPLHPLSRFSSTRVPPLILPQHPGRTYIHLPLPKLSSTRLAPLVLPPPLLSPPQVGQSTTSSRADPLQPTLLSPHWTPRERTQVDESPSESVWRMRYGYDLHQLDTQPDTVLNSPHPRRHLFPPLPPVTTVETQSGSLIHRHLTSPTPASGSPSPLFPVHPPTRVRPGSPSHRQMTRPRIATGSPPPRNPPQQPSTAQVGTAIETHPQSPTPRPTTGSPMPRFSSWWHSTPQPQPEPQSDHKATCHRQLTTAPPPECPTPQQTMNVAQDVSQSQHQLPAPRRGTGSPPPRRPAPPQPTTTGISDGLQSASQSTLPRPNPRSPLLPSLPATQTQAGTQDQQKSTSYRPRTASSPPPRPPPQHSTAGTQNESQSHYQSMVSRPVTASPSLQRPMLEQSTPRTQFVQPMNHHSTSHRASGELHPQPPPTLPQPQSSNSDPLPTVLQPYSRDRPPPVQGDPPSYDAATKPNQKALEENFSSDLAFKDFRGTRGTAPREFPKTKSQAMAQAAQLRKEEASPIQGSSRDTPPSSLRKGKETWKQSVCDICHLKKTKCDRAQPKCNVCADRGFPCHYSEPGEAPVLPVDVAFGKFKIPRKGMDTGLHRQGYVTIIAPSVPGGKLRIPIPGNELLPVSHVRDESANAPARPVAQASALDESGVKVAEIGPLVTEDLVPGDLRVVQAIARATTVLGGEAVKCDSVMDATKEVGVIYKFWKKRNDEDRKKRIQRWREDVSCSEDEGHSGEERPVRKKRAVRDSGVA